MAHFCSKHGVPFFKTEKMKGWAHPIKDADGENTGEWCNESQGEVSKKQWTPTGGYKGKSPEELELSRRSFALSYAKDLAVADKIEVKQIVFFAIEFYKWLVVEVNPTTQTVKETVKEVLAEGGMAIPEDKPAVKHTHVELAKPYATQQQLDTLKVYENKHHKVQELMDKHGFKKKLTKANADILIDEFVLLEDAK